MAMSMEDLIQMSLEDAQESVDEATDLVKGGKFSEAIDAFNTAAELIAETNAPAPKMNLAILLGRGKARFEQQDFPKALEDFKAALKPNANDVEVLKLCGSAAEKSSKLSEAKDYYRKVQKISPGADIDASIARVEQAEKPNPKPQSTSPQKLQSNQSTKQSDTPQAVLRAKESGNSAYKMGQFGEAMAFYTQAIDGLTSVKDETSPLAAIKSALYTNRAIAALKDGQLRACTDDCTASLKLDKTNYKAFYRRAVANEQREKYKEATTDFALYLSANPSDQLARNGHQRSLKSAKQHDPSWRPQMSILSPPSTPTASTFWPSSPTPSLTPVTSPTKKVNNTNPTTNGSSTPSTPTLKATPTPTPSTSSSTTTSNGTTPNFTSSPTKPDVKPQPPLTPSMENQLKPGVKVVLTGLSKPELNGLYGTCGVLNEKGRYVVTLEGGRELALKPSNLKVWEDVSPTTPVTTTKNQQETSQTPSTVPKEARKVNVKTSQVAAPPNPTPPTSTTSTTSNSDASTDGDKPSLQPQPATQPTHSQNKTSAKMAKTKASMSPEAIKMANRDELITCSKNELVEYIIQLRTQTSESNTAIESLNSYITKLIDKIMVTNPEILQA
eukprot:m.33336 g.33336  ORF g.33336 m.33336 type:complete len:613 (-) comp16800_c0_seq1:156-1994(-)